MNSKEEYHTLREAVDRSISHAIASGTLDAERNAAPIAMLRAMADYVDRNDGDTPAMRYVTPASFLSFCSALGLLPSEGRRERTAPIQQSRLDHLISKGKFSSGMAE